MGLDGPCLETGDRISCDNRDRIAQSGFAIVRRRGLIRNQKTKVREKKAHKCFRQTLCPPPFGRPLLTVHLLEAFESIAHSPKVKDSLALLQEVFWALKGRKVAKRVQNECPGPRGAKKSETESKTSQVYYLSREAIEGTPKNTNPGTGF